MNTISCTKSKEISNTPCREKRNCLMYTVFVLSKHRQTLNIISHEESLTFRKIHSIAKNIMSVNSIVKQGEWTKKYYYL